MGSSVGTGSAASHVQHRALDGGVGIGALAGQAWRAHEPRDRAAACACSRATRACGSWPSASRISSCVSSPALTRRRVMSTNVLALRLRALRDIGERVLAIELDVGLSDGAREHEPRVVLIEARGLGEIPRAVHRIGLPPPEIQIPAQAGAGLAHPERVSGERRRDDVVLRCALIQRARVEVRARRERRLRGSALARARRRRAPAPRASVGLSLSPVPDQPVELRILKGVPPAVGRRLAPRRPRVPRPALTSLRDAGFLRAAARNPARTATTCRGASNALRRMAASRFRADGVPRRSDGRDRLRVERRLQPRVELDQQPLATRGTSSLREIDEREIELIDDQRNEALDRLAARFGELQLHLAPIAVAAHALEQAPVGELVDDPGQRAAVVPVLGCRCLWG